MSRPAPRTRAWIASYHIIAFFGPVLSAVNDHDHVPTFIISLPKDRHRLDALGAQLRALEMPFTAIEAVHGASLDAAELAAAYDARKALRLFNRELSRGEIGCALSHVKIYRKMVEEDIPCALVLEDDAKILDPDLAATLAKLKTRYPAQTPTAVLLSHAKRYDGNSGVALDAQRNVYDAYRGVCAHGYFITRAAAAILLDKLYPVFVVADKWEFFQARYIGVRALVPYAIGLTPASRDSSIDGMGVREKKLVHRGSVRYYVRRHIERLVYLVRSHPFIRIEHQQKSELDLQ